MRQELITYDTFCQAVQKMQEHGEKILVRTILSHTGGSFAKIAAFLKRWREEQAYTQSQIDHEISPHLKQAILAEIGKAEAQAKVALEAQVAQASEQLEETCEILAKQEKMLEDYEQQVNQLNQQVAVMTQLHTQHEEKMQVLEKKLEQAVAAHYAADKQAAIADTRYAELVKQLEQTKAPVPAKGKKDRHHIVPA